MDLKHLLLLLPCHSLEDFPTHHRDEEALDLLTAWTTLWHPQLLQSSQKIPGWSRCEQPPDDCADHLILVPQVSRNRLPSGFLSRCGEQGGFSLETTGDRNADADRLLDHLGISSRLDDETVQQFYALSYTFLQIQLLTRQLRYSSNLDEVHFETQLLKAAHAACEGDHDAWQLAIDRCYDVLSEERHRYYPMDSYLVDITLLASTTLGNRFRRQLESQHVHNYLVDTQLMEHLRRRDPQLFQQFQESNRQGKSHLIGGGSGESLTGLRSYQSLIEEFQTSQAYFQEHFGNPIRIYARQTLGWEQTLPSVLTYCGYHGALHEVFGEGKIHTSNNTNFRWEGPDGQFLNSLTKTVLDASQPHVYLRLGIQIGEALDVDHLAIMQLVHWPDQVCPVYDDLVRSARRSDALGKWVNLDDVFAQVHEPGYSESIRASDYKAPYFQALSDLAQQAAEGEAELMLDPFQLARQTVREESERRQQNLLAGMLQLVSGPRTVPELHASDQPSAGSTGLLDAFSQRLTEPGEKGLLVVNPSSQARRVLLGPKDLKGRSLAGLPAEQVYHVSRGMTETWAVIDLPAMGYAHLASGRLDAPSTGAGRRSSGKILGKSWVMRNEFLEVALDPETGAIRSIHNYETRGNLCSLQLAWYDADLKKKVQAALKKESSGDWRENLTQLWRNTADPREKQLAYHQGGYTKMVAKSIKTLVNNSAVAKVQVRGTLNIRKKEVADFQIDYQLIRGGRFVEMQAEVTPRRDPVEVKLGKQQVYQYPPTAENPSGYRHGFHWRVAHSQPSSQAYRDLNSLRRGAPGGRFVAPYLVEYHGAHRLTWLCQGQPFHRVPADGKLDTFIGTVASAVLPTEASIGLGPRHSQALAEFSALPVLKTRCGELRKDLPSAAWLFQCSSRHVSLIHWENRYDEQGFQGVTFRLLETNGKQRSLDLDLAMPPKDVLIRNNDTNFQPSCKWDGSRIQVDIGAFEMLEIAVQF